MGKAEFGTPKYLANKMKAKGLQKLRWYCQMCQKQCRDENGFKCHTMSESHQRQLLLFADNSRRYIDTFSKEFADGYIEILRRQFGTKRVAANKVYQEYISDRNHLHMNATKWVTLTGFVQWLGRTGQCVVDETEKGWFITYIDRDPDTIARQEKLAKKVKMDKDDEERMMEFLDKQIEKGKKEETQSNTDNTDETSKEFIRENEDEKITLNITSTSTKIKSELNTIFKMPARPLDNKRSLNDDACSTSSHRSKKANTNKKTSALDDIIKQEELNKEKKNRKDYWLAKGIVVKLMTKTLGDKYYKEKAIVIDVIDKYVGKIKLIESGVKLKVDQEHLETVIPAIGKKVLILNGGYRNSVAVLKQLNEMNYSVTVEIDSGVLKGRIINNIKYEDISKINDL